MIGEELSFRDLSQHPCEFVLDELVGGDGLVELILDSAYVFAEWKHAIVAPKAPHEIPNRALFRHEKGRADP